MAILTMVKFVLSNQLLIIEARVNMNQLNGKILEHDIAKVPSYSDGEVGSAS